MEEKNHKKAVILGVNIDITSRHKILRTIRARLSSFDNKKGSKRVFFIVTPNPEQIMLAQDDDKFLNILNTANISLSDGVGLVLAYKFLKLPKSEKYFVAPILYFAQGLGVGFSLLFDRDWLDKDMPVVRGREVFLDLIKLANKKIWKVYLLGGWDKVAERTKVELEKNFKKVIIEAGTGPVLEENGTPINEKEKEVERKIIRKINDFKPQLLFVGFRAPVQEKWVYRWLDKLDVGVVMVVGGTFNYISGKAKLPPEWVAESGFEWLWRLLSGSQKTERIFKAFPSFPLKVFSKKLGIWKP